MALALLHIEVVGLVDLRLLLQRKRDAADQGFLTMVWLKLLGVLCAGVFIGAALVETVRGRHGEAEPSDADPSREGKARQAGPEAARREPP